MTPSIKTFAAVAPDQPGLGSVRAVQRNQDVARGQCAPPLHERQGREP